MDILSLWGNRRIQKRTGPCNLWGHPSPASARTGRMRCPAVDTDVLTIAETGAVIPAGSERAGAQDGSICRAAVGHFPSPAGADDWERLAAFMGRDPRASLGR